MAAERTGPSVKGLVVDDPAGWARRNQAEIVAFAAPRSAKLGPRAWLAAASAMEGRSARETDALVDAILRRAGLSAYGQTPMTSLPPLQRAALAIAEVAVSVAARDATVVVPEPPVAWPQRHEVRRLAVTLLSTTKIVLHAREAWELAALVEPHEVTDGEGRALGDASGLRAIVARTYGEGEAYEAFRRALDDAGVRVEGGPIAHVLAVPSGFGVREVLAAAHDAGLDVLEVRDALA
ncbi:MAG: hypothetical protein ACXVEF_00705 [Polyangiales bacterium]